MAYKLIEAAVRYSEAGLTVVGSGRDDVPSSLQGLLSGLARNFGDVFELWSGGQCGVGVVVSGDALE